MKKKFIWIWEAFALAAIIMLDRITKNMAVEFVKPKGYIPVIQDVIHLTYVENTGVSFGLLKDHRWLFMSLSSITIIALIIFMIAGRDKVYFTKGLSLAFITGGAIGNMIDRIAYKYVVDFIDFTIINFAVFNVADSFVVIGTIMLAVCVIFIDGKNKNENTASGK